MKKPDWVKIAAIAIMAVGVAWVACVIYVAHHFITKYW